MGRPRKPKRPSRLCDKCGVPHDEVVAVTVNYAKWARVRKVAGVIEAMAMWYGTTGKQVSHPYDVEIVIRRGQVVRHDSLWLCQFCRGRIARGGVTQGSLFGKTKAYE